MNSAVETSLRIVSEALNIKVEFTRLPFQRRSSSAPVGPDSIGRRVTRIHPVKTSLELTCVLLST